MVATPGRQMRKAGRKYFSGGIIRLAGKPMLGGLDKLGLEPNGSPFDSDFHSTLPVFPTSSTNFQVLHSIRTARAEISLVPVMALLQSASTTL